MSEPRVDLARYQGAARATGAPIVTGRLEGALGLVLRATGCGASIGDVYEIETTSGKDAIEAEVIGLAKSTTVLMPLGDVTGLRAGAPVRRSRHAAQVLVGDALIGRCVDALGRPLDALPAPKLDLWHPLRAAPPHPLSRAPIDAPFWTGIRVVDGMLTLGCGQRIGIFAGGGVGKSTMLGAMVRAATADVCVVALVGERAREVEEFVRGVLGPAGMAKAVVVAATSAEPPLLRARAALYATAVAEHFREAGQRVLLVMDSVTRYAMALREIGLAAGEAPTTKGYTPSVFASLAGLLERAGTSAGAGSITGIYTVLVEGDDLSDPIADAARAILDGHIVLSRQLAERGWFPAVDVGSSISRVMTHVVDDAHVGLARRARELLTVHREAEEMLALGAYRRGTLPRFDDALARMPRLEAVLRQRLGDETTNADATRAALGAVFEGTAT